MKRTRKALSFGFVRLVIIATRENLFASGTKDKSVFILGDVRSLDVEEGRIRVDDASIAEGFEGHQMFFLTAIIEPTTAEGQSAKFFVDELKEFLCTRISVFDAIRARFKAKVTT